MRTSPQLHTRFAPTPSGYLHLGNVYNFILNRLLAKISGGTTLLRIDDNDDARSNPVFLNNIFETLDFLSLDYETGPSGVEDFQKNWSQVLRREHYAKALQQLSNSQKLFACQCSRSQLAASGEQNKYNGTCENVGIALDQPDVAWRIKVPQGTQIIIHDLIMGETKLEIDRTPGSFIVRRKDDIAAYQISSLVDDIHFGINAIARGSDLLESTAQQMFLAKHLGFEPFSKTHFWHHPLLSDQDNNKLSKSAGSLALKTLQEKGTSVAFIYQSFGKWLGIQQIEKLKNFQDLLKIFQESKNSNLPIFTSANNLKPNSQN